MAITNLQMQKLFWDIESEFLYDYLFFALHLRFWSSTENTHQQYQFNSHASEVCFVNLFKDCQEALEDLGAFLLALKRRFNQDSECPYQKRFFVNETPIVYTIINYKPGEAIINNIIGEKDNEIAKILNLQLVEQINIHLLYPEHNTFQWKKELISSIKNCGKNQEKRLKMFNKIKHAGVVISNGKVFNKDNLVGPAVIYMNSNNDGLISHSLCYKMEEFTLMKKVILDIRLILRDLNAVYLIKYYPDFLKSKGFKSPLELLKKIEK